jgi:3'(2'), 5'-bisphosphate nucleotidase
VNDSELSAWIAQQAGQLLLDLRRDFGSVETKEQADQLRDRADRESHLLITRLLSEHRPKDAVLSEEGKDDDARLLADRVWIVDPLDGTWEFGQGRRDFAVHIALWVPQAQEITACTVDLPAQELSRTSQDPLGALPPLPTDRPIRIVASRSRPPEQLPQIVEYLSVALRDSGVNPNGAEIVDVGSVGAKVNEVISGRAEAYVHDTGFYEWDVAAPLGVAEHYGYDATHTSGETVTFNHMPPYVSNLLVTHPLMTALMHEAIAHSTSS